MSFNPSLSWIVGIPNLPANPVNFIFSTGLPSGKWTFRFMWFLGVWNLWVALPTGEIRQAGVYPNVASWTGFNDYYLNFVTTLDSIGQNDLGNVTLKAYQV
jgi:hypothetical protein